MVTKSSLLSPQERIAILAHFAAANQAIARDYLHRDDGILFEEAAPDATGPWLKPSLGTEEAREITRFIQAQDSWAYKRLVAVVGRGFSSLRPMRTEAVKFFRQHIPAESLAKARRHHVKSEKARSSPQQVRPANPLLLISVHFPLVTVNAYEALLQRHFGRDLVRDYEDRPLGVSGAARNLDALRKAARFARMGAPLARDTCVHGHFMPLKFMLPGRGHRKRFVAWMSDPVERLVAHYTYWKGSSTLGVAGGLQHRLIEEDWSLETFCLCPELRNIYSKFLWGFPALRFDFIGIAACYETELQRFSARILGVPVLEPAIESPPPVRSAALDADLRSKVERYHGADMALYRRALKKREQEMALLSQMR
jgi:hypothetical protein